MKKFLTDSRNTNIAMILLIFNCILIIIIGFFYAFLGTFMPYHIQYTGVSESEVSSYNSKLMILISVFIRLIGIYCINLGFVGIVVIYYGIRKKEKWAWLSFLISNFLMIIPQLIITYIITGLFGAPFLLTLLGFFLSIIALIISFKEIFKKPI